MKIGVIFPSRGMSFSETCEELLRELEPYDYEIFFAHGEPIPACFNKPLAKALRRKDITHIWFVEDDMVLPEGILSRLLDENVPVVSCDYPLTEKPSGAVVYDPKGQPYFTGTGCLLIKREVFDKLPRPVFRKGVKWKLENRNYGIRFTPQKVKKDEKIYGYHDVSLGLLLYVRGIPVKIVDTICYQRKLRQLGGVETNSGAHEIVVLNDFKKQDYTNTHYERDYEESNLMGVMLIDGTSFMAHRETVLEIIRKKKGSAVSFTGPNIVIDFTEFTSLAKDFIS